MEDLNIIELYWRRSESAIEATEQKYGAYCHAIANNILHDSCDSDECVDDAYCSLWDSIPPARPSNLKGYIAAIVRNIALNRYNYRHAKKRADGLNVICDEFFECLPYGTADIGDELVLKDAINAFLHSLTSEHRIIFMQRYWYALSLKDIAARNGKSQTNVKVLLHRIRYDFRKFLEKEGIFV